jgi:serine/threonine protein kinase
MNPEQRRLLADLLIQWEDLYRQGQDTPADVLCKEHPELAATLARQIAALKRVSWLDDKLEDNGDEPGDDSPDDPRPPKLLAGRYRLDQLIATGGFAEVWRAFDKELQRIIAVKIPKRTVVGSSESFLAEARRVARLKHPVILPVYDIGLEGNDCFFVSEYVEGGSLADRLVKGPLSPDQACRWITSIAEALNYAHASGVIHRDVKPANILIDAHDRALLTDFGIAQSSMKTGEFAPSIGTLRYMAPEQLDGQTAVPQSDIYSLAVVLHEALAGKPPYSSSEPNTLRREIGTQATISRDIPQRLVPALRKALNKDPGQRFRSAAEFASALRNEARPTPWLMPLGAVAAAGLLLGIYGWRSQPKVPEINSAHAAVAPSNTSPAPKPTVVRKEMPYPLPPYNRREWQSQSGPAKTFRFDADSGWWGEYGPDGKLSFRFRQTGITDEYTDVADPHRPVWLRLRANTCEICDSPGYKVTGILAHGAWVNESGSPYPPHFDQPVTITSPKDTLETYVRLLAKLTGVPITINVSALQMEGITKNQSFGLDERDQPARNVLEAILAKADTQGRLRTVLRATDDGKTAIDITTRQALGGQMKDTIKNSIGIEMRLIGPSSFVMGSDDTDPTERPTHQVHISSPFYIGVYEVTNAQ